MAEQEKLQFGTIEEKDDVVVYEIPIAETNLVEAEQLEELKRKDALFFECQHYVVEQQIIRIFYKKESNYKKLKDYRHVSNELKKKAALNMLKIESLIGTQYTTLVHPENIYVNAEGDIKFAHRGIRSVFPKEEMNTAELLEELKRVLLYVYSSYQFNEISEKLAGLKFNEPIAESIRRVQSISDLKQILHTEQRSPAPPPIKQQAEKTQNPNKKMTLLSGVLLGLIIGMLVIYVIQVIPLNNEVNSAAAEGEAKSAENIEMLTEKNKEIQQLLDDNRTVMHAYRSTIVGDTEEAITQFESANQLDESAERTLMEQYIELDTVESLTAAAGLGEAYHIEVIKSLVAKNSDKAKEAILAIESSLAEVQIEQAWINKSYEEVVTLHDALADNKRAKLLAARSYIQLDDTEEAIKLAKDLDNKKLHITALKREKKLIEANDDLDKDEKEEAIDKIDDQIDDLN